MIRGSLLLLVLAALLACAQVGDWHAGSEQVQPTDANTLGRQVIGDGQLTDYVRRILQDSRGHYWFGSNGDGVYRYDGATLVVFSVGEGLAGAQVTGILEDRRGHIWISTDGGVSRFDGKSFT